MCGIWRCWTVYISWKHPLAVCVTECTLCVPVVYPGCTCMQCTRGLLGVLRCGIWRCWTVCISLKRLAAVCVTECTLGVPVVYPGCTCSVPWSAGCVEMWDLEMLDCVHQLETPGSGMCEWVSPRCTWVYSVYPQSGCVEVWDLWTLDCVHQLKMPGGSVCD